MIAAVLLQIPSFTLCEQKHTGKTKHLWYFRRNRSQEKMFSFSCLVVYLTHFTDTRF